LKHEYDYHLACAGTGYRANRSVSRGTRGSQEVIARFSGCSDKVLGEQGKSLSCQDLIEEMSRKGYWTSPNGATPQATLYAAIMREIKTKGKEARFEKTERGKFASAAK
jgi:hypothetical protein